MRKAVTRFMVILASCWLSDVSGQQPIAGIPTKDSINVYLDTVVRIDSASKEVLFSNARLWFSENFKSSKDVIDLADVNIGVITGHGNTSIVVGKDGPYPSTVTMFFNIKVSVKDGRYRLEVYNVHYESGGKKIGDFYIPLTTTYPNDWYFSSAKAFKKIKQDYADGTVSVLNKIFSSLYTASQTRPSDNW